MNAAHIAFLRTPLRTPERDNQNGRKLRQYMDRPAQDCTRSALKHNDECSSLDVPYAKQVYDSLRT